MLTAGKIRRLAALSPPFLTTLVSKAAWPFRQLVAQRAIVADIAAKRAERRRVQDGAARPARLHSAALFPHTMRYAGIGFEIIAVCLGGLTLLMHSFPRLATAPLGMALAIGASLTAGVHTLASARCGRKTAYALGEVLIVAGIACAAVSAGVWLFRTLLAFVLGLPGAFLS